MQRDFKVFASSMSLEDKLMFFIDYIYDDKNVVDFAASRELTSNLDGEPMTFKCTYKMAKTIFSSLESSNICDFNLNDEYLKKLEDIYNALDEYVLLITNEIENNGIRRPFDILDYYLYIGIDPEKFITAIKILRREATVVATMIFQTKSKEKFVSIRPLYLKDDERIIRKGTFYNRLTGEQLTKTEVDNIISFLKRINAPISVKLFNTALERYITGEINLKETFKGKIKRSI